MKVTYDARHNVAYIRFREATTGIETVRVSDELNVDVAPDGAVYGIELLNANEQLAGAGGRVLSIEDTVTGKRLEVAFPEDAA
ncbi:MAG: DUF2283 domain-containing protein [Dehalococcoidia bacterium]